MSKILPLPWPWTSNFKWNPFQMITNQLKENKIQGSLSHVITSFFQVGVHFQYQLIDLVWLSFDFFSFNWSFTICFCVACLYSCVSKLSKCITKCLLFIFIHILVVIFTSACFLSTNWKRKQITKQQPHRACEQTKPTQNLT